MSSNLGICGRSRDPIAAVKIAHGKEIDTKHGPHDVGTNFGQDIIGKTKGAFLGQRLLGPWWLTISWLCLAMGKVRISF